VTGPASGEPGPAHPGPGRADPGRPSPSPSAGPASSSADPASSAPRPGAGRTHRRPILRRLCASVLVFEAIVLILAVPVAITIEHLGHGVAGGVGGGLALAAVVLAGLVGRVRWALIAGTVLQVLIIVAGIEVSALYVLGVIFAAFWFTGIWMANRLEHAGTG
jgi:Protein of unknown function (DUF4233)